MFLSNRVSARFLAMLLVCGMFFLMCYGSIAAAQDRGNLGPLKVVHLSVPNSVKKIADPTGEAPTKKVYSFSIVGNYCNSSSYRAGFDKGDCTYQSVRSQMNEGPKNSAHDDAVQPAQSWYGWYSYFPNDFPFGDRQVQRGLYTFLYWHGGRCPHISISDLDHEFLSVHFNELKMIDAATDSYQCNPKVAKKIARIADLLGRWLKFEAYIKWSTGDDGVFQLYMDGKLVVSRKGANIIAASQDRNNLVFGLYLASTGDVTKIKPANMLYAGVKSAKTREGLFPKR